MEKPASVEAYINSFDDSRKQVLSEIRQAIREAAPDASEKISYGMPAFVLHGNLVYYAAFTNHIGLYALPSGNAAFQKELSAYKTGKGSIQFPLSQPMPIALIKKIVTFRVKENLEKEAAKLKK